MKQPRSRKYNISLHLYFLTSLATQTEMWKIEPSFKNSSMVFQSIQDKAQATHHDLQSLRSSGPAPKKQRHLSTFCKGYSLQRKTPFPVFFLPFLWLSLVHYSNFSSHVNSIGKQCCDHFFQVGSPIMLFLSLNSVHFETDSFKAWIKQSTFASLTYL